MKKVIKVLTADGKTLKIMLDNWGGGMDHLHRRWTLAPEGWHCVDNGQIAMPATADAPSLRADAVASATLRPPKCRNLRIAYRMTRTDRRE